MFNTCLLKDIIVSGNQTAVVNVNHFKCPCHSFSNRNVLELLFVCQKALCWLNMPERNIWFDIYEQQMKKQVCFASKMGFFIGKLDFCQVQDYLYKNIKAFVDFVQMIIIILRVEHIMHSNIIVVGIIIILIIPFCIN